MRRGSRNGCANDGYAIATSSHRLARFIVARAPRDTPARLCYEVRRVTARELLQRRRRRARLTRAVDSHFLEYLNGDIAAFCELFGFKIQPSSFRVLARADGAGVDVEAIFYKPRRTEARM